MKCAICNSGEHRAIETVERENGIRRRRRCDRCGHRWTTWERDDEARAQAAKAHLEALRGILGARG